MRLCLIRLADWFDARVLGHRAHWVCCAIAESKWWGEEGRPGP